MTQDEIYLQNYSIVYGYLLSLCGNVAVAEDLAAETFLKALQHANRYDGSCKVSTWLCTIAKNLYINEQKKQCRHRRIFHWPRIHPDPEAQLIHRETVRQLWETARQLEEPYGPVFFMRMEGLSFREIGETMDKTENWARVTFYRAKVKIQERTEDLYE